MAKTPKVWFTADPHVGGHRLVARLRGFVDETSTEEHRGEVVFSADTSAHDEALGDTWDATVAQNDIVYVLGDISINGGPDALEWFRRRHGVKILVSGNHDPVHPGFFRNGYKKVEAWREVFADIQPYYRLSLLGSVVLLSHLPYAGTGAEGVRNDGQEVPDRGPQWRLPDLGAPLLHGHTHGPERAHLSDNGTPQLHVGLDAWDQKLVPQDTVLDWLEGKEV